MEWGIAILESWGSLAYVFFNEERATEQKAGDLFKLSCLLNKTWPPSPGKIFKPLLASYNHHLISPHNVFIVLALQLFKKIGPIAVFKHPPCLNISERVATVEYWPVFARTHEIYIVYIDWR